MNTWQNAGKLFDDSAGIPNKILICVCLATLLQAIGLRDDAQVNSTEPA